jgi:hypothetical protein
MTDHRLWRIGDRHVLAYTADSALDAFVFHFHRWEDVPNPHPSAWPAPTDVTDEVTGEVEAWWPERGRTVTLAPPRPRRASPQRKAERNAWIVEQYQGGRTMSDIASEAGISTQRVSQIVRRAT